MSLLLFPTADFRLIVPRKGERAQETRDTGNKTERKSQRRGPSVKRAKNKEKLPLRNKQETCTQPPNTKPYSASPVSKRGLTQPWILSLCPVKNTSHGIPQDSISKTNRNLDFFFHPSTISAA